jgi:thymidine kinase
MVTIDEAQFFPDIIEFLNEVEKREYKGTIILSALLGDSNRKKWDTMDNVMQMMDSIQFLQAYCAYCKDGTLAPFSKCIVKKDSNILIGGSNEYVSVCRRHFNN